MIKGCEVEGKYIIFKMDENGEIENFEYGYLGDEKQLENNHVYHTCTTHKK